MAGEVMVVRAWKEWGIQAVVLLSFTLQVALLVLSDFRRRMRSGVLMFFTWSAYMMADAVAIYALGHMSVISRSPEHRLMAFWAPFLLVHLGGQDNITAYAIEDNQLWLRHLQTLAVQVAAAACVIYSSSIITGGPTLLRWATLFIFLLGAVKYGERVWALWCAQRSATGNNYISFATEATPKIAPRFESYLFHLLAYKVLKAEGCRDSRVKEFHILMAHLMLNVPKSLLQGSPANGQCYEIQGEHLYKVVEMQLSLMHDVFYTKKEIIHSTWYGICIRVISVVATTAALVLFNLLVQNDHRKEMTDHNRVDVAITYVLLVGAVVLETLSMLRAAFSCWTFSQLKDWFSDCNTRQAHIVSFVRRHIHAANWRGRGWSASMGQHNLLQLSVHSRASRISKMARWMGLEDSWNMLVYLWSIPVSNFIEDKLMKQLFQLEVLERKETDQEDERDREDKEGDEESWEQELVLEVNGGGPDPGDEEERGDCVVLEANEGRPDPGEEAEELLVWDLVRRPADTIHQFFDSSDAFRSRVPTKLKGLGLYTFGLTQSIEERILIWHIATNIYLTWWYQEEHGDKDQQSNKASKAEAYKVEHSKQPTAEIVEALSNYMVFLLAARPDMVSPTGSRTAYIEMCYALATRRWQPETVNELARKLQRLGDDMLRYKVFCDRSTISKEKRHIIPSEYGFFVNMFGLEKIEYHLPSTLLIGCKLGAMLIRKHAADTLDVISQVWVETLCYAAKGCSAYAHAKQLSNGGELITVVAVLLEYLTRGALT
ncbi:hypothetical protein HU200_033171 [Digitaria exilis]|uniref:DUF4220 domain-containing protein n=1 Tax=Digitaria exilis TaxID=1010633 RepID=A0A835EKT8_9POAL|nr:hypothetical protein HU200_033171 [Digitaria exilis]